MTRSARLRFDAVSRRFGALPVLSRVGGELAPGELLLVTGPNGCGKSTLLRCLAGLLRPDSGTIELALDGAPADPDPALRRSACGYLSPDLAFYDELTVAENLDFFCRLRRTAPAASLELARELQLPLDRRAGVLSSGMRQRLRWVWLEIGAPRLLLLDEPFQNLDAGATAALSGRLAARLAGGAAVAVASPDRSTLPPLPGTPRELRLAA